jgi:hypothetical protein
MIQNFDLISDLYLDTLEGFTWEDKATSLFCIIAGNISSDHSLLFEFLEYMGQFYDGVFFIDGELEHAKWNGDFDASYASLRDNISTLDSVFFLHENIIILPNVTLLATNGWTTFDFTSNHNINDTMEFLEEREGIPFVVANKIFKLAVTDQHYMYNSIEHCQEIDDIANLIVVTNSVPIPGFIVHNDDYDQTVLGDTAGNSGIADCLSNDIKGKVSTWVFGKYPDELDHIVEGVRYASNPGLNKDPDIYFPKVIKP